jgi:hypothetical protein
MANNYYDATGVLMLERVTPVITALFGGFDLDESYPGDGQAYIARLSESSDPQWSDVLEALTDLASQLDLPVPDDDDSENDPMGTIIEVLAKHFLGSTCKCNTLTLVGWMHGDQDEALPAPVG